MKSNSSKRQGSSLLSQLLSDYLEARHLRQEDLADYLSVDVRTLRRYKNGESVPKNIQELQRIADLLGIEPERLGVTSVVYAPLTLEQIDERLQNVWSLVGKARNYEARVAIEKLIKDLREQIKTEDRDLLTMLARSHYVAGYVTSLNTHTTEIHKSIAHFQQMENVAHILHDDTFLNLALTYHGDMLRRDGRVDEAITHLEAARDTTPNAELAARGNGIQLLGRAYVQKRESYKFEKALAEAASIVDTIDPETSSTNGLYCLGTVYEEYGRSYGTFGQMQKALEYLDKAEKALPPTKRWNILLMTTRAVTLVRGGEFRTGGELAIEAGQLCRAYGNIRCLERVYGIQHYLERLRRDIGTISVDIREALDGPLGYWEVPTQG